MIQTKQEILNLLEEISKSIDKKINIYIIGGAAMMFYERKDQTKDIDLVVATKEEYNIFKKALEKLNFKSQVPTFEYKKLDLNQIYILDDFRIDIFEKRVCRGFFLSESMIKRSEKIFERNNLAAFTCSSTDIFLFKTFTERQGDIDDCISLAKADLLWEEMLEEIKFQIKVSKKPVWITYIGERLDLLEEKGLKIPFMKDINRLRQEFFDELENKFKNQL